MGGSRKSKMVSWASGVNLCQVRLFLSEEFPSQVGMGNQDNLQAKASWPLLSGVLGSEDSLPPGFDAIQPADPWKAKLSQMPLVRWRCSPRFQVDSEWQMVAGEESRETEAQNQREMRVLEAIYPRPSSIPQNPSMLAGAEDLDNDDHFTPVVPITSTEEDEDLAIDMPIVSTAANHNPMIPSQPQHLSQGMFSSQISANVNGISAAGVDPSIVVAAQAALSSVMPRNDNLGNLLDPALLIKILSNPKLIEQLVTTQPAQIIPPSSIKNIPTSGFHSPPLPAIRPETAVSSGAQHIPPFSLLSVQPIRTQTLSSSSTTSTHYSPPNLRSLPNGSFGPDIHRRDPPSTHTIRPELRTNPTLTAAAPFYPQGRTGLGPSPNLRPSAPAPALDVIKDINYYKSLIQQHGGERRDATMTTTTTTITTTPQYTHHQSNHRFPQEPQKPKPRTMKPCIFFNSPRGCRNGANCTFLHEDMSFQQRIGINPEVQSTKRMKLDGA